MQRHPAKDVTKDTARQPDIRKPTTDARPARSAAEAADEPKLVSRHLTIGWWAVALFAMLGLLLETLHAFKIGSYLDVSNDTRRLMWTLAHAHGTLLGLVNIAFALTVRAKPSISGSPAGLTSTLLRVATLLLPLGFFLGGIRFYAGDPGVGIVLVPIGALALVAAAVVTARAVSTAE